MENEQLADTLIERLNKLIEDPDVRKDISRLIETRVVCSTTTVNHPTIQAGNGVVGFLGVLNGLVGAIEEGPKKNWGFITAEMDDDGHLETFRRT